MERRVIMFSLSGFVVVKETNNPLAGLRVVLFELDPTKQVGEPPLFTEDLFRGQRLGSVLTTEQGAFAFSFDAAAFRQGDLEQRPDLLLYVLAPEDTDLLRRIPLPMPQRLLHFSLERVRDAGDHEEMLVRIPAALIDPLNLASSYPTSAAHAESLSTANATMTTMLSTSLAAMNSRLDLTIVPARRAKEAFASFSLSRFGEAFRGSPFYARQVQDLGAQLTNAAQLSLTGTAITASPRYLRTMISRRELEAAGLTVSPGGISGTLVDPAALAPRLVDRGGDHYRTAGAIAECTNRSRVDALLDAALPLDVTVPTPVPPNDGAPSPASVPPPARPIAELVAGLLSTATTPEESLRYRPADPLTTDRSEIEFSVPRGPADVTAYYNFQDLQIAFDPIWSEVFDTRLEDLGKRLYREWVSVVAGPGDDGRHPPPEVANRHELEDLVRQATNLLQRIDESDPLPESVLILLGSRNISEEVWGAMTRTERDLARRNAQSRFRFQEGDEARRLREPVMTAVLAARERLTRRTQTGIGRLARELDSMLAAPYRFDIFAGVNLGVLATYRQAWEPAGYQAGRLVSSLPLAPKETRRYTVRQVTRTSGTRRETREQITDIKDESTYTDRAESEIVNRARERTSFENQTRIEGGIEGVFSGSVQNTLGIEAEKSSESTRRNFREAVVRSAYEYRQSTKIELESVTSTESSSESTVEISNPNDEITVTYLMYELERQFLVSEQLHKVTPVILVAYEVPAPHEVTRAWLVANAWILRKVLLDPSLEKALTYLHAEYGGDAASLQTLKDNMERQIRLVDEAIAQMQAKTTIANGAFETLRNVMLRLSGTSGADALKQLGEISKAIVFGPFSLFGQSGDDGSAKREEVAKITLERADRETKEASGRLSRELVALESATEKYVEAHKRQVNMEIECARLTTHVLANILYYMQAVWDHEPPDQRYFRIYNRDVPWIANPRPLPTGYRFTRGPFTPSLDGEWFPIELEYRLPATPTISTMKLYQVADLDQPLGYKGNYAIFRAKKINYMHMYMMQPYLSDDGAGVSDPNPVDRYSMEELLGYLGCVREHRPDAYAAERERVRALLEEKLKRPWAEKELVTIPTGATYIEALPGKHPILEDFKRVHRALDVKKVQAETRGLELENLRRAARLIAGEREDPDIERKIVVEGTSNIVVPTDS
jgi:hypothetical protein